MRDRWQRATHERRLAVKLIGVAVGHLAVALGLLAAGPVLLAQLAGGLSLVPFAMAVFVLMLPPTPRWDDGGDEGGGSGVRRGDPGAPPPAGPDGAVDWGRFERDFSAHARDRAAERELVEV